MSIQSEITRISGNVSDAFAAITNKGVTVPAGSTSDDLADLISQISGGGSGLVYESGTYTPTANTASPTISFSNSHTDRPFFVMIADISSTVAETDSVLYWAIMSMYDVFGSGYMYNSSSKYFARVQYSYKTSSSISQSGYNISNLTGTNTSSMPYYLSNTAFYPYAGSTSRYFRSGRTYKWIAVWNPTT